MRQPCWNAQIGNALNINVDLVKWETHSLPMIGEHPQKILNEQLVSQADFGIAIFWGRLGTPTNTHISGTAEEIDGMIKRGLDVSIYICGKPIEQSQVDDYPKLRKYLEEIKQSTLISQYNTTNELRELLLLHVTRSVINLAFKERGINLHVNNEEIFAKKLEKPNVVIKLSGGFVPSGTTTKGFLSINVQNHSGQPVFMGGVMMTMKSGDNIFYQRDAVTHNLNNRKELRPGESFSFYLDPEQIKEDIKDFNDIKCFTVQDDIERTFTSSEENIGNLLNNILAMKYL